MAALYLARASLKRVDAEGRHISHLIAQEVHSTPLQAFRAIEREIEETWVTVGPLVEAGELLQINVRSALPSEEVS